MHSFSRTDVATEPMLNQAHTYGRPLCDRVLIGGSSAPPCLYVVGVGRVDILSREQTAVQYLVPIEFEVCSFYDPRPSPSSS